MKSGGAGVTEITILSLESNTEAKRGFNPQGITMLPIPFPFVFFRTESTFIKNKKKGVPKKTQKS
jgi:hypothetical protein